MRESQAEIEKCIASVSAELARGRLEGNVQDDNTANVSYESLLHPLQQLKLVSGRNSEALATVYSTDAIITMRKLLTTKPTSWQQVRLHTEKLLKPPLFSKLIPLVVPEIQLAYDIAGDRILCLSCLTALNSKGAVGTPEALDVSHISVMELDAVCTVVGLETSSNILKTEKVAQLVSACRILKSIRENLLKANSDSTSSNGAAISDYYSNVKGSVATAFKLHKNNHTDAAWGLIKEEVSLAIKAAHIYELKTKIEDCVFAASRVYAVRAAAPPPTTVNNMLLTPTAPPARRGSMLQVQFTPDTLLCTELDNLIEHAYKMDTISNNLGPYIACISAIRRIRNCVIDQEWEVLKKLKVDPQNLQDLRVCANAGMKELENAYQEYLNKDVQDMLEKILRKENLGNTDINCVSIVDLNRAIVSAESVTISAVYPIQLLECAKKVLQLRKGFATNNNAEVGSALQWLEENNHKCPIAVQQEVVSASKYHQNKSLISALTIALSTGSSPGNLDYRSAAQIDTTSISKCLQSSTLIKALSDESKELLRVAEVVYAIRCAQRAQDFVGLKNAMHQVSKMKHIHHLVIDEIAAARADIENESVILILSNAINSFEGEGAAVQKAVPTATGGPKGRRYSYINMNCQDIDKDTIDTDILRNAIRSVEIYGVHTFSREGKRLLRTVRLLLRIREAMKADDWNSVRSIIDEQENRGTIASKLTKSAGASSSNSMHGSSGLFGDLAESSEDNSIDVLADKEIQVVHAQLEMRNSLTAVMKYIGIHGSAKCCYGLVDIKPLLALELFYATEKAIKSVEQEQQLTQNQKKPKPRSVSASAANEMDDDKQAYFSKAPFGFGGKSNQQGSPTKDVLNAALNGKNEATQLLLVSAKHLAEVRMLLYKGQHEAAGVLAEKLIFNVNNLGNNSSGLPTKLHPLVVDELYLYATEVGEALMSARICKLLTATKATGDIPDLAKITEEAITERNGELWDMDLGLVRIIDLSLTKLSRMCNDYGQIQAALKEFSVEKLLKAAKVARANNITSAIVNSAEEYSTKLKEYEMFVETVCQSCGGGLVIGNDNHKSIVDKATQLNLESHLLSRRSAVMLDLHPSSLRIANIVRAVAVCNIDVIIKETLPMKRAFLSLPSCIEYYQLAKFPLLRESEDFSIRMTLESSELRETMLLCSDKNIPTSMTRLSPPLAVYATYVFAHCLRPIQQNVYANPGVVLRNLILLGRFCPPLRDEILLQIMKQLRNNPKDEECYRLWRVMGACLKYFPPSAEFENYLELFLLQCYNKNDSVVDAALLAAALAVKSQRTTSFLSATYSKANAKAIENAPPLVKENIREAAYQCIYSLHGSIIRHGYGSRITSNSPPVSLELCRKWLQPEEYKIDLTVATKPVISPSAQTTTQDSNAVAASEEDKPVAQKTYDSASFALSEKMENNPNRCSKQNWQLRFNLFSQNKSSIDCESFIAGLCSGVPTSVGMSSPGAGPRSTRFSSEEVQGVSFKVDRKDYQVFMLIINGQYPTHKAALIREYIHEGNNFINVLSADDASSELLLSHKRRCILKKLIYPPQRKPEDKYIATMQFWKRVVLPILTATMPGLSQQIEKPVVEAPTSPNPAASALSVKDINSSTAPAKSVAKGGKYSAGKQNVSTLMEMDENSPANVKTAGKAGKAPGKSSFSEASGSATAAITWPIYRDIVMAGIEWLIEHESN